MHVGSGFFSQKKMLWLLVSLILIALLSFSFSEIRSRYSEQNKDIFWPNALEKFSAVTEISITREGRSFSLVNDKERGWILPHSNHFPVSLNSLRTLLSDVANLKILEQKGKFENLPENFGLNDAAEKNSSSTRLTFKGKEQEILLDLVVGLPKKMGNSARSQNAFYARKSGTDEVFVLTPMLEIANQPEDWFALEPLSLKDFAPQRISVKAVAQPNIWEFIFSKEKKWQLSGAGSKALPTDAAEQLLALMSPIKTRSANFDSPSWSDKLPIARIVFDFSDAKKITLLLRKHEGKILAQMQFSAEIKQKKPEWVSLENVVFSIVEAPDWLWP